MIISVAVWRIYPSWVNDKLWAWKGLSHFGMFWGEALKGRFSFEARKYLFSFHSYVHFAQEFFCFPRFCKIWRQTFERWGFWLRRCLGALLETPLGHRAPFCELRLRPRVFFENFLSFFKAQPVFTCLTAILIPRLNNPFGDDTSKIIEWKLHFRALARLSEEDCRDWYQSLAVIHGPKREKKHKEVSVWLCQVSTLHHRQTSEFWRTCFQEQILLPFCTSLFSCTWMYSCRLVRLQLGDSARKAINRSCHPPPRINHQRVANI